MAAAPVNPTPDDVSALAALFEWFRQWGGPFFGSSALGGAYLAGRKVTGLVNTQEHHGDKIEEHSREIEALKAARLADAARSGEYATRSEVSTAIARESETTRQEMRAGFANLTQLVGALRRD